LGDVVDVVTVNGLGPFLNAAASKACEVQTLSKKPVEVALAFYRRM